MSAGIWGWLLAASALAYAIKLSGYLIPARWFEGRRMRGVTASLTVGLLAGLTAMNAFGDGPGLRIDARIAALAVAALALWLRLPFLLVVILGGASAAALRWFGVG